MKKKGVVISIIAVIILAAICIPLLLGKKATKNTIRIGTKEFTESRILGYLYKDLVESNTDYTVDLQEGLGGTSVCFNAVKAGEIDGYIEYSGTAYGAILQLENEEGADVFGTVRQQLSEQFNIACLDTIGFNNTYCLAMLKTDTEKYGITKLSDLIDHQNEFRIACSFEFLEREDGLKKLKDDYDGIVFAAEEGVEGTLKYIAVESGEVDLIVAFATDGMLQKYEMLVLEDDRQSMFPYDAFPLFRQETLKECPGLEDALNMLSSKIPDADMSYMNYLVDAEGKTPQEVAHQYLVEHGLVK